MQFMNLDVEFYAFMSFFSNCRQIIGHYYYELLSIQVDLYNFKKWTK